ncbi:MAG: hypothetical protein WBD40_18985 [Tepidisphaeraceae bacterium]
MSDAASVMFQLRATRAAPPSLAGRGERRRTYGAALTQFDELIAAATAAGAASRPLALFYALSQAGRAITAAQAPASWRLRGHGLSCPGTGTRPLAINVLRDPGQRGSGDRVDETPTRKPRAVDAFSGVAEATESDVFQEKAALGALWSSLPEIASLLPADTRVNWLRPLLIVPEDHEYPHLVDRSRVRVNVVGYHDHPETLCNHIKAHYPTAASVDFVHMAGLSSPMVQRTDYGTGILVSFPAESPGYMGHVATLDRVATRGNLFEPRHLRPAVSGVALSPLMSWWTLLFGLSMLARYEPAGWTAALALDSSPLAAPLDECLRRGVQRIPELVLDALSS